MVGFFKDKKGYPRDARSGRLIHRAIAQDKIGRKLRSGEVVHHQDGDKSNFRRNNLSVMSRSFHSKLHTKMRKKSFW